MNAGSYGKYDVVSTPYTYFLKNKVTGEKYYGVRYARGCHPSDLWTTYFSSSKQVAERIIKYGASSFDFEVRKVFSSPQTARTWEEKVLRRMKVLSYLDWLNRGICGKFFKDGSHSAEHVQKRIAAMKATRGANPEIGLKIVATRKENRAIKMATGWRPTKRTLTLEQRDAISKGNTGKKRSVEQVQMMTSRLRNRIASGWHPPAATPERCAAISKRLMGVKKSVEHVAHMKCHDNNKTTATCPTCGKTGQYVNMKRWHFENCGKERKLYTCPHCGKSRALPGVMRYHFDNCKHKVTTT